MKLRYLALLALFVTATAFAAEPRPLPAPPIIGATSYLVIDNRTGHEIAALEPDKAVAPASLTKLMTAYTVFKSLRENHIQLNDEVTVSEKAWRAEGSRMFIEVGKRVSVEDPYRWFRSGVCRDHESVRSSSWHVVQQLRQCDWLAR
jgi:D-alanyl-D-alanine carboxypeptidase (penicillin-binding protein 5/6)